MNAAAHPFAPEEIMAFLDGQLSADRAQSISSHVNDCAECRTAIDAQRATAHSLENWTIPAAPLDAQFETRLFAAATTAAEKKVSLSRFNFRSLFRRPRVLGAVSVVVVLLIFLTVSNSFRAHQVSFEGLIDSPRPTSSLASPASISGHINEGKGLDQIQPQPQEAWSIDSQIEHDKTELEELTRSRQQSQLSSSLENEPNMVRRIPSPPAPPPQPMIVRNVSLSIVVKDFDASRQSLDTILARHSAYSADLTINTQPGSAKSLDASLRVPAPQLASVLAALKSLGRVEAESQKGEEVTQQHTDLVARLKNSRETEQRLQAILTQRTGKISDVLEVEQEIARVRGEIEQMEAEQQNLEHRVDFATIDLKLSEEYKAQLNSPTTSIATQFRNAFVNGFRNAFETLFALVLFFTQAAPSLILWCLLLGIPAWFAWRRYRRAHQSLSSITA